MTNIEIYILGVEANVGTAVMTKERADEFSFYVMCHTPNHFI